MIVSMVILYIYIEYRVYPIKVVYIKVILYIEYKLYPIKVIYIKVILYIYKVINMCHNIKYI